MSCEYSHNDGAYVLGALSPTERLDYERHLATCADCARSVRDLAGLPGLLSRIPSETLEVPPVQVPVPDTLLPNLINDVRRARRRRTWTTAAVAAAAAVVVTVSPLAVFGAFDRGSDTASPPAPTATLEPSRPMVPVGGELLRATLSMTSVAWGTRLDLSCSYPANGHWDEDGSSAYAMFVRTRDGRVEKVATWKAVPGRTMRLSAATAASRQDIEAVEVRTVAGTPVLTLMAS